MESQHRERIFNNLNLLAERTQWNIVLEEKLQTYKIFNSTMIEDLKKVSQTTNNMINQYFYSCLEYKFSPSFNLKQISD